MIQLAIPGRDSIQLEHLVCDVNGTLAIDGIPVEGVGHKLVHLTQFMNVHLITADTHGKGNIFKESFGLSLAVISPGDEAKQKADFITKLGQESVAAIGQGYNDALMLREAALGICVLSREGLALEALRNSDLLVEDIITALDLLENPHRITASLRR